jgi:hypothetical protein
VLKQFRVAYCYSGDNFYPNSLNSSDDPLFNKSFAAVYTANALEEVPWHAVLGNHGEKMLLCMRLSWLLCSDESFLRHYGLYPFAKMINASLMPLQITAMGWNIARMIKANPASGARCIRYNRLFVYWKRFGDVVLLGILPPNLKI